MTGGGERGEGEEGINGIAKGKLLHRIPDATHFMKN